MNLDERMCIIQATPVLVKGNIGVSRVTEVSEDVTTSLYHSFKQSFSN